MSSGTVRDAALADFEQCRLNFEEAVRRAPDAALSFRPAGEDYALGGLVVHVSDVLHNYAKLLVAIRRAEWQAMQAPTHETSAEDAATIHDGFGGAARGAIIDQMRAAHSALVTSLVASDAEAFTRKADVTYAGSSEPYPTSPADVLGWVRDHYNEHTQQISDLVSVWAASTR